MAEYDLKRLEVAIQYINRMVSGRNPVTNRPAPENEVLTNPNVNRCLQFVSEILQEVKSTGGIVGKPPRKAREPKPSIAETFPYEILQGFQYRQDQQISYFLKQIGELFPEDQENAPGVSAPTINNWLRANGYLEKRMMEDIGKEASVPTEKGAGIGIYSERAGIGGNEYYRIWYNQQAQQFLIDHFRQILTDTEAARARKQEERKVSRREARRESGAAGRADHARQEPEKQMGAFQAEQRQSAESMQWQGQQQSAAAGQRQEQQSAAPAQGQWQTTAPAQAQDDPAFASLLSSVSPQDLYGQEQGQDPYGMQDPYATDSAAADFFGDGWESADSDIPW